MENDGLKCIRGKEISLKYGIGRPRFDDKPNHKGALETHKEIN